MAGAISGISANERLAMERSQGSSKGIASAVVAVSEAVLASATAVAALSCEALQAQVLLSLACMDLPIRCFSSPETLCLLVGALSCEALQPRYSPAPVFSAATAQTVLVITLESQTPP